MNEVKILPEIPDGAALEPMLHKTSVVAIQIEPLKEPRGELDVKLPVGARLIRVGLTVRQPAIVTGPKQPPDLCPIFYFQVNPDGELKGYHFAIVSTGDLVESAHPMEHRADVSYPGGRILHIFEELVPNA